MKPSKILLSLNLVYFVVCIIFFIFGTNVFEIKGLEIDVEYWSNILRWGLLIFTLGVIGFIVYRIIERVTTGKEDEYKKDIGIAIACLIILLFSYGIVALTG